MNPPLPNQPLKPHYGLKNQCRYEALGTCRREKCVFKHRAKEEGRKERVEVVQLESRNEEKEKEKKKEKKDDNVRSKNSTLSTSSQDNYDFDDSIYNFGVPIENIDFNPSSNPLSNPSSVIKSSKPFNYAAITSQKPIITEPPIIRGFIDRVIEEKQEKQKCVFFNMGNCRYGKYCKNIHDYNDIKDNIEEILKENNEEYNCCICLDKIKIFGLLPSCTHAFCLGCIKQWRTTNMESKECPICRQVSHFVLPSIKYLTDLNKESALIAYQDNLSTKPCKHFNFGDGECPFGTSCFYSHKNRNGIEVEPNIRYRLGEDGKSSSTVSIKLGDFIKNVDDILYDT